MTIDSILKKCLRDSGAEGSYCIAAAKSAIRELVMEKIPKENMPVPVEPLPSADISFAKGWNDCLAEVRARLEDLLK